MGMFDFVGDLFNKEARGRASRALQRNETNYKNYDPTQHAQEAGANAYDSLNPDARAAQSEALSRMANIGATGGMDEGAQAALKQAQMNNAAAAKATADAGLERAQAAGRLNSGRALAAQMAAKQGAANANAMAGTQAVADARGRAMSALANSGAMAGSMRGQDQTAANAQNQINQFNANMRYNAENQTQQNEQARLAGLERFNNAWAGANNERANQTRQAAGDLIGGVIKGGVAAATGGIGGFADGGFVPGKAEVSGDSEKNDTVPAKLSPGEMVVPRSVVAKGPDAVREFALRLLRGEG